MNDQAHTDFGPLFTPEAVAVAGMSTNKKTPANRFVADLREFGFRGPIYAIHPTACTVDGVPAYPGFDTLPEIVDYAYVAVAAQHLPELLRAAKRRVRFAQVMSSGFAELPGEHGKRLEEAAVAAARAGGVRMLGPNCLGTYSPRGRMTFVAGAPNEPGNVGLISQSGGLAVDFIRRGSGQGLRFSGVVTVGNSADVDPTELLAHYLDDPETHVVGLYLENCKRGRSLFELLNRARGNKPVVLLKGGRSEQGSRAAASHTGALASNDRMWVALCRQTGTILVETLDQFLNVLTVLQHHASTPGHVTRDVALVGNGGGTSVLASDAFWRAHLGVPQLAPSTIDSLQRLGLPPGTSLVNPVDTPAGTVSVREGRVMRDILTITAADPDTDALVAHFNLAVLVAMSDDPWLLLENLHEALQHTKQELPAGKAFVVVVRSDGDPVVETHRRELVQSLLACGIPVLEELIDAAHALGAIRGMEQALANTHQTYRDVSRLTHEPQAHPRAHRYGAARER